MWRPRESKYAGHAELFDAGYGQRRCEICSKEGRDFDEIELSLHASVVVAPSRAAAEKTAPSMLAPEGQMLDVESGRWLLGTAVEVRDQLARYIDVGVSDFVFGIRAPFDL